MTAEPTGPMTPAPAGLAAPPPLNNIPAKKSKPAVATPTHTTRRGGIADISPPVRGVNQIPGQRRSLDSILKDITAGGRSIERWCDPRHFSAENLNPRRFGISKLLQESISKIIPNLQKSPSTGFPGR
jgi:hypothetical protein